MIYATKGNMITFYSERELIDLTDRPDPATGATTRAIVDAVLDEFLSGASSRVDGYLVGRYSLPLDSSTPDLARITGDIARRMMYAGNAPKDVMDAFNDAIAELEKIQQGLRGIGRPDGDAPASSNTVLIQSAGSVFSRERR